MIILCKTDGTYDQEDGPRDDDANVLKKCRLAWVDLLLIRKSHMPFPGEPTTSVTQENDYARKEVSEIFLAGTYPQAPEVDCIQRTPSIEKLDHFWRSISAARPAAALHVPL